MHRFVWVLGFFLFGLPASSQTIDPYQYIATLRFDKGHLDYLFWKKERFFPVSFAFNTMQDGNGDGTVNVEDACENIVKYAIGDSVYGTGRTGLSGRGPNDQCPAVYFHFVKSGEYDVYQYWLYYADNDFLNNHEHDWEKYFVYVKDSLPVYVWISSHSKFKMFKWSELGKDQGHIVIGVFGGSHAMDNHDKNGVEIRFNGQVSKRAGRLDFGDGKHFLWKIYSNDSNVKGAIAYVQTTDCFYSGDPAYSSFPALSNGNELEECNPAPWKRKEWKNPPLPEKKTVFY